MPINFLSNCRRVAGKFPTATLRTRLFLNLIPFVVILFAVGLYAIVLFSRITSNVDITVTGNYRSVTAAQQMKLFLERIRGGVLTALDEREITLGRKLFEKNRLLFDQKLDLQLQNASFKDEKDLTVRLANNFSAIEQATTNIFIEKELETKKLIYTRDFSPAYDAMDRLLDEIHDMNHAAILATTEHVQKISRDATRLMILGILIALVISSYACYKLAYSILQPIQCLTQATHDLGEGKLDQMVPVVSRDELGDLAESFNKMAARLKVYQASTAEKIVRLHRTMETTLASFPDPIFVLDSNGSITLMNPAAMEMSQTLDLKNELPERLQENARKALTKGESFLPHSFNEVVAFRLSGHEKSFLPRILAMRNEENALFGVAVVLYDVTRFRLLDDAKTNLVATVSHEIRTPLTSVRMVLHLLLEKTVGPLTSRQNDLLEAAREDAERLLRILNDLLDLTRLEQGNPDLHKEKITPAELVQNVTDMMRETIVTRGLTFRCCVEPDLPCVVVDRQRINHVFTNLINNAVKYSPPEGEILLSVKQLDGQEVEFSVSDRGPGIPEDYQDRIFDRFFRVPDQTKTGAGLGLSIAREIVVAHGGRIGVKSRPDQGTEFYFLLNGVEQNTRSFKMT
ncbi:MAG: resE [Pedosphaera sp.]|nr:resE [Pedosphaera sp.]